MKKTNLIIDGNNIFYQSLFVLKYGKSKTAVLLNTEEEQEMLMRKVATDLAFTIKNFNSASRIIFTMDSQSWRKSIEIEENDGYKSTRKKSTEINWKAFYNCMNNFASIIEKQGIIVSKIDKAEGDDLMYLWNNFFKQKNENCIIVTSDKDMLQLISFDKERFSVVYRPNSLHRKIVVPIGFINWLKNENVEEADLFNPTSFIGKTTDIITNAIEKIPVEELNPNLDIINKVMIGDGGDSVPTIFSWKTKTSSGNLKTNRITPKRVEKILNDIGEDINVLNLPTKYKSITNSIIKITKQKDIKESLIKERLERNIRLVVLDESIIPTEIQEDFLKTAETAMEFPTVANTQFSMQSLLEGTKYVKAATNFQSDIFSGINKYTKNKKKLF